MSDPTSLLNAFGRCEVGSGALRRFRAKRWVFGTFQSPARKARSEHARRPTPRPWLLTFQLEVAAKRNSDYRSINAATPIHPRFRVVCGSGGGNRRGCVSLSAFASSISARLLPFGSFNIHAIARIFTVSVTGISRCEVRTASRNRAIPGTPRAENRARSRWDFGPSRASENWTASFR